MGEAKKITRSCYHCKNITRNFKGKPVCRLGIEFKVQYWEINKCKKWVSRTADVKEKP